MNKLQASMQLKYVNIPDVSSLHILYCMCSFKVACLFYSKFVFTAYLHTCHTLQHDWNVVLYHVLNSTIIILCMHGYCYSGYFTKFELVLMFW